jgi:SsrA-binding protein
MALVSNKKVHLNYDIKEKLSAGIELLGLEVKSLRAGKGSLDGSRVLVRGGEAYAMNVFIPPYQEGNAPKDFDPYRNRRLLLTKSEIQELSNKENLGLTIVPISLYLYKNLIKCDLGVGKKKHKGDKRDALNKEVAKRTARNVKENIAWYDYE